MKAKALAPFLTNTPAHIPQTVPKLSSYTFTVLAGDSEGEIKPTSSAGHTMLVEAAMAHEAVVGMQEPSELRVVSLQAESRMNETILTHLHRLQARGRTNRDQRLLLRQVLQIDLTSTENSPT